MPLMECSRLEGISISTATPLSSSLSRDICFCVDLTCAADIGYALDVVTPGFLDLNFSIGFAYIFIGA